MIQIRHALGIDIGGTKISAALVDEVGNVSFVVAAPTPARAGPQNILDVTASLAKRVTEKSGIIPTAYGLGSAGAFDFEGTVLNSTDHLTGWAGTRVSAELEKRLGAPISVLNDVHAAALGELWNGRHRRVSSVLFIAVGTGIGGAVLVNGRVLRGVSGLAGSIGHVAVRSRRPRICSCGGYDHVEAYSSGPAIELSYRDLTQLDCPLVEIGHRARAGEPEALDVIREAAWLLGDSIASAIAVTDPGAIVLGGGVLGLGELFTTPLASRLGAILPAAFAEVVVETAALGNHACMAGAAAVALRVVDGTALANFFS